MLSIENILWVIPGVVFIFLYNRLRSLERSSLSGWPYVFLLVLIATITWLPAEWIVKKYFCFEYNRCLTIVLSIVFSIFYFLIIKYTFIQKLLGEAECDNFFLKCIELEKELIFLTLKNDKVYIGILWKYPEAPWSKYESQIISIIPLQSGFRRQDRIIKWNIYYPEYENHKDFSSMETLISRSEIVTFGKFNKKVHEHFQQMEEKS